MVNPFAGIITQDFKDLHRWAIEALLEDSACTTKCRVVYPPTKPVDCHNCEFNVSTGRSAGIYTPGGPYPFARNQLCPLCLGQGTLTVPPQEEDVFLMVVWDYRSWINFDLNTQSPAGRIQTLSKASTVPILKRANKLIVNVDLENQVKHVFQRDSEVEPCGLDSKDFVATLWKRI